MAYKCSCVNQENTCGRYIENSFYGNAYKLADQSIKQIENITGYYDPNDSNLDCPWRSYENPIWKEVSHFLSLKEIPGTSNIDDTTDNIVYEAVLFYERAYKLVNNHIENKRFESINEKNKNMNKKYK